ncbi:MAG: PTS sugar transporter subunit IIA [Thermoguttaceae bacterium]|nr:PTS sugar transporter subunit IIA [Thermoguttaceae bacterium]
MKFGDFILRDSIIANLQATTQEGVIHEMTRSLVAGGGLPECLCDAAAAEVLAREENGATAMGNGVALPHAKIEGLDRVVGTVCVSSRGVDFKALDAKPVKLFFLILSPTGMTHEHGEALSLISKTVKDAAFPRYLQQARSREEVLELLDEIDSQFDA